MAVVVVVVAAAAGTCTVLVLLARCVVPLLVVRGLPPHGMLQWTQLLFRNRFQFDHHFFSCHFVNTVKDGTYTKSN